MYYSEWQNPATHTGMFDRSHRSHRSPCATSACAVMAVLHEKGQLRLRQNFVHNSILDSMFVGRLEEETQGAGKQPL